MSIDLITLVRPAFGDSLKESTPSMRELKKLFSSEDPMEKDTAYMVIRNSISFHGGTPRVEVIEALLNYFMENDSVYSVPPEYR